MNLKVSEIFYSVQGEGFWVGTPTVFVRLVGCNLNCSWCDTQYAKTGGENLAVEEVISRIQSLSSPKSRRVCLTGGEPLLQDIEYLLRRLRQLGYFISIETNGTLYYSWLDEIYPWVTVSPKNLSEGPSLGVPALRVASEVKIVVDGPRSLENALITQKYFEKRLGVSKWPKLFVQPESMRPEMTEMCIEFVKTNPQWRVSLQVHKILKIR